MLTLKKALPKRAPDVSQSFINTLLEATDIVKVIGREVPLKGSGANRFGLCPFHGEKSPSFSVSVDKQMYHCFGCGKSGDAIAFLREHGGLSFLEALAELAQSAGMAMPNAEAPTAPAPDLSEFIEANRQAAAFFQHCLKFTPTAHDYLQNRGLGEDARERFILGYAPEGWQSLQEAFRDYASSSTLLELGLVIEKKAATEGDAQNTTHRYDRFRERIMFGIRDARGRIVGWGGRSLDGSLPKYMNSPQSSLFDKSSQLFGLYEAREGIRRTKQVIVTEGFFDTISNSMAGITQTVATMGTACTEHHLKRLTTLAPEVIFCFDGDKAGLAAAWKSVATSLPFAEDDKTFRFMILPPGKDPDEVIREQGADAYRAMLANAQTLSGFLLSHLAETNGNLQSAENRAKFLHEGLALIELLPAAGRLKGILRRDLQQASDLKAPSIPAKPALVAAPPVAQQSAASKAAPWKALTQAVLAQQKCAASQAEALIELLSPASRDAFFDSNFSAFPDSQQAFWRALDEVILKEDHQDQETPLCAAQRDLLAKSPAFVRALLDKEDAAASKASFRSGLTSEDDFIAAAQAPRVAATEKP